MSPARDPRARDPQAARALTMLRVMWVAMIASVLLYAGSTLAALYLGSPASPTNAFEGPTGVLLALLALGSIGVGLVVRRSAPAPTPRRRSDDDPHPPGAWQSRLLIGWALQEGGGLFLVTLGFLGGAPSVILGGALTTAFALALSRPRPEEWGQG